MEDKKVMNTPKEGTQSAETKANEKKVEQVTSSAAKVRKESWIQKRAKAFVSDDAKNVGEYVMDDILIPALKKVISDMINETVNTTLYGRGGGARRSNADRVSYRDYYNGGRGNRSDDRVRESSRSTSRSRVAYEEVVVASREEADAVLQRLDELIDMYGVVSIADLYDLVGVQGRYTDNKYGWTNVRNAEAVRVRDGYEIRMPKVGPID